MDFNPKADFAKGPHAAAWTEVAGSAMFRTATSAALLQMNREQGRAKGFDDASANCFRMEGAREVLSTLMNLTTPPPEPRKPIASENLDHRI